MPRRRAAAATISTEQESPRRSSRLLHRAGVDRNIDGRRTRPITFSVQARRTPAARHSCTLAVSLQGEELQNTCDRRHVEAAERVLGELPDFAEQRSAKIDRRAASPQS